MLNSLKLTFQSNNNDRILQGRIQMGERLPSLNLQKLIFWLWFCTIRKTTFVTKGHFVIYPLFSRSSVEVYFVSLTVENPQWELTTKYYWNHIPLTLLAVPPWNSLDLVLQIYEQDMKLMNCLLVDDHSHMLKIFIKPSIVVYEQWVGTLQYKHWVVWHWHVWLKHL